MKKIQLAIFASGNGTNAEKIITYFKNHSTIEVNAIFYNKVDAGVRLVAENNNIDAVFFKKEDFNSGITTQNLISRKIDYVILAGFLWLIPKEFIQTFHHRIINIHPSILPKFGGKGMYGINVHKAVKLAGENETGITIHLVNEEYDKGRVIAQYKTAINEFDTSEDIALRVQKLEHEFFPKEIEKWIMNER